jgi:hypothetical protein
MGEVLYFVRDILSPPIAFFDRFDHGLMTASRARSYLVGRDEPTGFFRRK